MILVLVPDTDHLPSQNRGKQPFVFYRSWQDRLVDPVSHARLSCEMTGTRRHGDVQARNNLPTSALIECVLSVLQNFASRKADSRRSNGRWLVHCALVCLCVVFQRFNLLPLLAWQFTKSVEPIAGAPRQRTGADFARIMIAVSTKINRQIFARHPKGGTEL